MQTGYKVQALKVKKRNCVSRIESGVFGDDEKAVGFGCSGLIAGALPGNGPNFASGDVRFETRRKESGEIRLGFDGLR